MAVLVKKIQTLTGHNDCVYTLQKSDQPNLFFSGGGDGVVALWNLENPELGQLIAKVPNSIYSLHFHPQTKLLIAGQNYEGIHLLDWKEKRELRSLKLSSAAIFDIQSHNNDVFISTGDGTVWVVDLQSWSIKKKVSLSEKNARVIAISPLAQEIAVGYSDNCIRVFALEDMKLKYEWMSHKNSVFTLAYTPDGKLLLSGSRDARLKSWDAMNNYAPLSDVAAHLYAINHIVFHPEGNYFATASMDKSVKIWKADEMKLLKVIDKARHAGHGTSVNKLLWTSFNDQLVSAGDDRRISIWNVEIQD